MLAGAPFRVLTEDTGVAAYQGQAPRIHQNAVLGPAAAAAKSLF